MQESPKGFFDSMNPKASFVFGIVTGVAIVSILAMIGLFGGDVSLASKTNQTEKGTNIVADTKTAPAPSPPSRTTGSVPIITDEDHIRGDKNAPLTWVEYSDFECPFCKRFAPTMEQMLSDYDGKIKLVYRHFPLSFHNPLATTQAEAVECVNELKGENAFWQMHDFIFATTSSNGNGMSESQLVEFAEELGIDRDTFQSCIDDDRYVGHIQSDSQKGAAAGVTGTPGSFFIDADGNAQLVSGALPYSQIQAVIDAALN